MYIITTSQKRIQYSNTEETSTNSSQKPMLRSPSGKVPQETTKSKSREETSSLYKTAFSKNTSEGTVGGASEEVNEKYRKISQTVLDTDIHPLDVVFDMMENVDFQPNNPVKPMLDAGCDLKATVIIAQHILYSSENIVNDMIDAGVTPSNIAKAMVHADVTPRKIAKAMVHADVTPRKIAKAMVHAGVTPNNIANAIVYAGCTPKQFRVAGIAAGADVGVIIPCMHIVGATHREITDTLLEARASPAEIALSIAQIGIIPGRDDSPEFINAMIAAGTDRDKANIICNIMNRDYNFTPVVSTFAVGGSYREVTLYNISDANTLTSFQDNAVEYLDILMEKHTDFGLQESDVLTVAKGLKEAYEKKSTAEEFVSLFEEVFPPEGDRTDKQTDFLNELKKSLIEP